MRKSPALFLFISGIAQLAGIADAKAQSLSLAASHLDYGRYYKARDIVDAYYAAHYPRRYSADFIRAASNCRILKGSRPARAAMLALKDDYYLTGAAAQEVDAWIASCVPPPPPPQHAENGNHLASTSSGLSMPPTVASAVPSATEPLRLPLMSNIVSATSFSGDDYATYTVDTVATCLQICRRQPLCRSVTYALSSHQCWLKRSVPPPQHGNDFVSARKLVP